MRLLFLCFISILAACSAPHSADLQLLNQTSQKIVNGTPSPVLSQQALATVALYLPSGVWQQNQRPIHNFCTATLISSNVLLTAAHCIVNVADSLQSDSQTVVNNIIVGFGTKVVGDLTSSNFQFRIISSFKVHPQYTIDSVKTATKEPMYDVALLKLDAPAPTPAQPVQLSVDPNILQKGLSLLLVGFGLTATNPSVDTTQMLETNIQVELPVLTSTQFAYMNTTTGSCNGDSGGPAYVKTSKGDLAIIGITSWGDRDCKQFGVYTSVPAMKDWIVTTIPTL